MNRVPSGFAGTLIVVRARASRVFHESVLPSETSAKVPAVSAATTVQALLTDKGLQVSNRTDMHIQIRCHLGTIDCHDEDITSVEAGVSARQIYTFPDSALGPIADVSPPSGVLRHWSHESEIVFEGGERRLNGVDIEFRGSDGRLLGSGSFRNHSGMGFAINAREISALIDETF